MNQGALQPWSLYEAIATESYAAMLIILICHSLQIYDNQKVLSV